MSVPNGRMIPSGTNSPPAVEADTSLYLTQGVTCILP